MSEVFASGLLFGFAAAWSHMLLWNKWEQVKERKARQKQVDVEFMQMALDADRYSRKETNYGRYEVCDVCHGVGACAEADDGLNCAWMAYAEEYKR